jgi:hypothetical protein
MFVASAARKQLCQRSLLPAEVSECGHMHPKEFCGVRWGCRPWFQLVHKSDNCNAQCLLPVCRYGIDGLIIDPYNELDPSRASGLKEHEHVNQTMAMLRKFARDYNVCSRNPQTSPAVCMSLTDSSA